MSEVALNGGCRCGAVRYCWCRDCQYWAAGSCTVNAVFPVEAVTITGKLTDFCSTADSGNQMHRQFCPSCGTPITSASQARPHLIILRGGTFDEPAAVRPVASIWTSSAPDWACVESSLPAFEKAAPA